MKKKCRRNVVRKEAARSKQFIFLNRVRERGGETEGDWEVELLEGR